MTLERDPDDLLTLARRGALSDTDERRLHALLAASPEARWLHQAGLGFDEEAPVRAGDDLRIARILARVEARRDPPRRLWLGVARAALVGVLVGGVAIGAVEGARDRLWPRATDRAADPVLETPTVSEVVQAPAAHGASRSDAHSASTSGVPARPSANPRSGAALEPALPDDTSAPEATSDAASLPSARFDDAQGPTAAPDADPVTAATLFASANRARMRGDVSGAIALYRDLAARFPRSSEAAASAVTLGVLHLERGEGAAALAAFKRARGTAEALWGEARALRTLGRGGEERGALERLLAAYPGSAYAASAHKRLAELP